MLDAYIIEKIRKERFERDQSFEQGRRIWLELPDELPNEPESSDDPSGPIIIPLYDPDVEDAA